MKFEQIVLRPLSWQILSYIYDKEPKKAEEIAKELGLSTKQVDAAITRTLVRRGFCIREFKLTRLMKRQYAVIKVTNYGMKYVQWRNSHNFEG